jgi:hypothetical protein
MMTWYLAQMIFKILEFLIWIGSKIPTPNYSTLELCGRVYYYLDCMVSLYMKARHIYVFLKHLLLIVILKNMLLYGLSFN